MRKTRILDAATQEAAEAAAWYERERPGLGFEFDHAVDVALDLLEGELPPLAPMPGSARTRGVKRLMLRRFPYDVVIQITNEEVLVLAFAHHARRPGYWRDRIRA